MKRWWMIPALAMAALLASGPVDAQTSEDGDFYEDEEEETRDDDRFAFGIGAGLVEPSGDVETYLMASLRIRASGRGGDDSSRRGGDEGITGYIEPEVGYWKHSEDGLSGEDLLIGANLVGVVPMGMVDTFFGVGAGVHLIDAALLEDPDEVDDSAAKLGANSQFGLDLYITPKVSAFGVGRFDLVQDSRDSIQSKVYLGLRARF